MDNLLETLRQIEAKILGGKYQGDISVDRCGTSDGRMTVTLRLVSDWTPKNPNAVRPAIQRCRAHASRCDCGECGGHGWTVHDEFKNGTIDILLLMGG